MQILFAGSRSLPPSSLVSAVVGAALASGHTLSCGCCCGADQQIIMTALAASGAPALSVHAAFGPTGKGSFALSAVPAVQAAAAAGARVTWATWQELQAPLPARLAARSRAALAGCAAAVFFRPGEGSLKIATLAVRAGHPVFVFAAEPPAPLPLSGAWVISMFQGFSCYLWQSAQTQLFE